MKERIVGCMKKVHVYLPDAFQTQTPGLQKTSPK